MAGWAALDVLESGDGYLFLVLHELNLVNM